MIFHTQMRFRYQHTIHHAIKVFVGVYLSRFSTQISKEMSANQWFNAELEYHHLQLSWCSCSVQCQVSALKDLVSAALWLFTVTEVKCWFRRAVRREWCHSSPPRVTQCCWLPETALPLVFALVCVRRLLMPTCHFLSFSWVIFPSSAPHVIETTLNGLPQPSLGAIQYCSDINLWCQHATTTPQTYCRFTIEQSPSMSRNTNNAADGLVCQVHIKLFSRFFF